MDYKGGLRKKPELVKVYEKLARGIWCYKGFFELLDAKIVSDGNRDVFKYYLKPVEKKVLGGVREIAHARLIPSLVKVAVWKRDQGRCVMCGSNSHLHFDHDIPFSKGGSSITVENVRLLCARHNLSKSDKIMILLPLAMTASSTFVQIAGLRRN